MVKKQLRIHLIAIGGKIMHSLAIELQSLGHEVSGSDDEIYDPALTNLSLSGLLPHAEGWNVNNISKNLDLVILGMHAREDNPELLRAQELGLRIESFPSFMYEAYQHKIRILVTGSHGKTTVTSMIIHALKKTGHSVDYLVGGEVEGLDRMVRVSDEAPVAVIEGDEYLCSRIHRYPKMLAFRGNIIILTGIEWDHMNVFPTLDNYVDQFRQLLKQMNPGDTLFYFKGDKAVVSLVAEFPSIRKIAYGTLKCEEQGNVQFYGKTYPINVFGSHNMANMNAARSALRLYGVSSSAFLASMATFSGAGRRLQILRAQKPVVFWDYAHAPSKVRATISAVAQRYADARILAVYELHTYSSLNKDFLPHYKNTFDKATSGIIFIDQHAMDIKRMPPLADDQVLEAFDHYDLTVLRQQSDLRHSILCAREEYDVILLMSSGTFAGWGMEELRE